VDLRVCNTRFIESLISAGAFDTLPGNRAQKLAELSRIIDQAVEKKESQATGQIGLFGFGAGISGETESPLYAFEPLEDLSIVQKLEQEKELLGIYLSARPLDQYRAPMRWLQTQTFAAAKETQVKTMLGCCQIKSMREIMTKKGDRMAFVQAEDLSGAAELVVFPKVFSRSGSYLASGSIVLLAGELDHTSTACKVKVSWILPMAELFEKNADIIERLVIRLPADRVDDVFLQEFSQHFAPGKTVLDLVFMEQGKALKLRPKQKILCDASFVEYVAAQADILRVKVSL
jgi:DNA polymerase-3 subunit alpha